MEKILNEKIEKMFDNTIVKGVKGSYGYAYNPTSNWIYLLKADSEGKVKTLFVKGEAIEKTLGCIFFDLNLDTQVKIIEAVFNNKVEKNNFKLSYYYIYLAKKTGNSGLKRYNSLEELKNNIKNIVESKEGYIGIGLEYTNKNGDTSMNGIGGVDLIRRININDAFIVSPDYQSCGLNLTKEQKQVFFIDLIKELNN